MKEIFQNIQKIFKNPKYSISYIILVIILAFLWYSFTDLTLIRGNNGEFYFWSDTIISWINILGFPLFILAWIYRSYTLGSTSQKSEKLGFLGGVIGILISGSLCCGSSLFLVFGASALTNIFSKYLPYGGLELKIFGAIILLCALFSLLKNLLVCKVKIKKSSK